MNSNDSTPLGEYNDRNIPVIGLTGGIGTGKSTAASYLASRGMVHIDADAISRQLTEKKTGVPNPVLEEIGRVFDMEEAATDAPCSGGDEQTQGENDSVIQGDGVADRAQDERASVIRSDGSLDRARMARIVFHDPGKKKLLEGILFREIVAEIHRRIDAARKEWTRAESEAEPKSESGSAPVAILLDVPLLFESGLDSLCDKVILLTTDLDVRIRRVTARDRCAPEDVEARIRNQMPDEEKMARADYIIDNSGTREELHSRLEEILTDQEEKPAAFSDEETPEGNDTATSECQDEENPEDGEAEEDAAS